MGNSRRMVDFRPTHAYVARLACGCAMAVRSDYMDKETGRDVGEWIARGMTVERVTFEKYREEISKEATFMNCPHQVKQDELFGVAGG